MVAAAQRLNETLEEHVRRIAHALHDDAGQSIVSALMVLDELRDDLPTPAGDRLQKLGELLARIEERIRHLARELRPIMLDDLGLRPALEFLAGGFAGRRGLAVHVDVPVPERLPPLIETTVYRVVQEALTNVARHAAATYVAVSVRREGDQLHWRRSNGPDLPPDGTIVAVPAFNAAGQIVDGDGLVVTDFEKPSELDFLQPTRKRWARPCSGTCRWGAMASRPAVRATSMLAPTTAPRTSSTRTTLAGIIPSKSNRQPTRSW